MATTFKTFLNDDRVSTRTLLHEAIPVTGSLIYGTYPEPGLTNSNIKLYTHGMFQSVYDYTYTKSSANHIFDLTVGYSSESVSAGLVVTADTYKTKKQTKGNLWRMKHNCSFWVWYLFNSVHKKVCNSKQQPHISTNVD